MTTQTSGGENIRELDIYRVGDLVANYIAHTLQPDLVVVAGDVWDTPNPGPLAVRHGFDFHQTLRAADIPVIVIGGNHDTLTSIHRATPLEHLQRYFDCRVVTEQESFEMMGLSFHCIPYRTISRGTLEMPQWSETLPNILVAHSTADGADLPSFTQYDKTRLVSSVVRESRIALGMLGHIHIHGEVAPNIFYSGALERLTWGEIDNDPSIYLHSVDTDGTRTSQSIPISSMGNPIIPRPAANLFVPCGDLTPEDSLLAATEMIKNASLQDGLLQLTLQDVSREIKSLPYEDTLQLAASKSGVFALKVRTVLRDTPDWNVQMDGPTPGATLADIYRQWAADGPYATVAELGAAMIGGETV